jgi:hypothetical protein
MLTAKEKVRLMVLMDHLADEVATMALGHELKRLRMHPDFESRKIVKSQEELAQFLTDGAVRLGLEVLFGELNRLAEQFEVELSNSHPGEIIELPRRQEIPEWLFPWSPAERAAGAEGLEEDDEAASTPDSGSGDDETKG